jgi:hypothetical protein
MSLRAKNELFYTMTTMFIDNIINTYDLQETSDEPKLKFLRNIVQYCERHYDQTYEGHHPKAQDDYTGQGAPLPASSRRCGHEDGWLVLKDQKGEKHDVAYRGIWSIEKLKELMAAQFSVKPEDLHMTLVYDSFTAHE